MGTKESTGCSIPFAKPRFAAELHVLHAIDDPVMETATLWHRVLNDPQLQELPYKIETNEHGQIVLSPHKPHHGLQQGALVRLLNEHVESGAVAVEFAVDTAKGVKVPDVVWMSEEQLAEMPDDAEASPVMPEVVVEVLSEGNTDAEIADKRRLYLAEGAQEVWTCATDDTMTFYDETGAIESSAVVPSFPCEVE
jgi:Uma2 family endonuclease